MIKYAEVSPGRLVDAAVPIAEFMNQLLDRGFDIDEVMPAPCMQPAARWNSLAECSYLIPHCGRLSRRYCWAGKTRGTAGHINALAQQALP